jgi:hypothetical protein
MLSFTYFIVAITNWQDNRQKLRNIGICTNLEISLESPPSF